jgi:hypothetical protein
VSVFRAGYTPCAAGEKPRTTDRGARALPAPGACAACNAIEETLKLVSVRAIVALRYSVIKISVVKLSTALNAAVMRSGRQSTLRSGSVRTHKRRSLNYPLPRGSTTLVRSHRYFSSPIALSAGGGSPGQIKRSLAADLDQLDVSILLHALPSLTQTV